MDSQLYLRPGKSEGHWELQKKFNYQLTNFGPKNIDFRVAQEIYLLQNLTMLRMHRWVQGVYEQVPNLSDVCQKTS